MLRDTVQRPRMAALTAADWHAVLEHPGEESRSHLRRKLEALCSSEQWAAAANEGARSGDWHAAAALLAAADLRAALISATVDAVSHSSLMQFLPREDATVTMALAYPMMTVSGAHATRCTRAPHWLLSLSCYLPEKASFASAHLVLIPRMTSCSFNCSSD